MAAGVCPDVNTGVGFTTTVTLCVLLHAFAVSVTKYTTLTGAVDVFVNVSLMDALLPLPDKLLIPDITARLQLKVVPTVALVAV
jgi:hypothetical protein